MNDKDSKSVGALPPNAENSSKAATHGESVEGEPEILAPDIDLGALGGKLSDLYSSWLEEPIPDRFKTLLDELDQKKPERK